MYSADRGPAKIIETRISEITDSEIKKLTSELALILQRKSENFEAMLLLQFLQLFYQCNGASEKPIAISTADLDAHDLAENFLLRKKVGTLGDGLFQVCRELAQLTSTEPLENFHGTALYVFLNRRVIRKVRKAKGQRRLNTYVP